MLIRKPSDIVPSEITPASVYEKRRTFIKAAVAAGAISAFPAARLLMDMPEAHAAMKLGPLGKSAFSTSEEQTPYDDVTSYNNFYEFGTGKGDPVVSLIFLVSGRSQGIGGFVSSHVCHLLHSAYQDHIVQPGGHFDKAQTQCQTS